MRCTCGKVRNLTRQDARRQLRQMKSKGLDTAGMNVYRCPSGSYWHVGHATAVHREWLRAS